MALRKQTKQKLLIAMSAAVVFVLLFGVAVGY